MRIVVYGVTGSGKTTLASKIADATGVPWHSIDDLTWEPGWVAVAPEEQRRRVAAICSQETWIIDTAYRMWLDIPLARATLVVGLDYPRWVSLTRLIHRTFARMLDKTPTCNGNTESLRVTFSRDSIIVWHFRSFKRKRARIRSWADSESGPALVRLTKQRETEIWLAGLRQAL
jgi:adenylate kinase family enzyme